MHAARIRKLECSVWEKKAAAEALRREVAIERIQTLEMRLRSGAIRVPKYLATYGYAAGQARMRMKERARSLTPCPSKPLC
jgi:hypothetical protein